MTSDVRTASPDTPLEEVVRLMERYNIKRVPIVELGKVVGIVTRANLLHAMAEYVRIGIGGARLSASKALMAMAR